MGHKEGINRLHIVLTDLYTRMHCLILPSGTCYYEKGLHVDEVKFKCDDNLDRPGTASCQEPGDWVEG